MDNQEIKQIIEHALVILYRTEKEIIGDETHEQSVSARLMLHLQHLLPEWNVDMEFNRQGENRDPKTDLEDVIRKPDIVVHKRGHEGPNLAVVLIKPYWNEEDRESDKRVCKSLKDKQNYQVGFFIELKEDSFEVFEI